MLLHLNTRGRQSKHILHTTETSDIVQSLPKGATPAFYIKNACLFQPPGHSQWQTGNSGCCRVREESKQHFMSHISLSTWVWDLNLWPMTLNTFHGRFKRKQLVTGSSWQETGAGWEVGLRREVSPLKHGVTPLTVKLGEMSGWRSTSCSQDSVANHTLTYMVWKL